MPEKKLRPFEEAENLSGVHLQTLRDWLEIVCDQERHLTVDYKIGNLVADLDSILDGMWNDGIDAMGEDA